VRLIDAFWWDFTQPLDDPLNPFLAEMHQVGIVDFIVGAYAKNDEKGRYWCF
jgi:hypothetical protein